MTARPLALDIPVERLYGFTVPEDGAFDVLGTDEVYRVDLDALTVTLRDDVDPFDALHARPDSLGIKGGAPVLSSKTHSMSICDSSTLHDKTVVIASPDAPALRLAFKAMSGDWFAATLSRCGRFALIGDPYALDIYALG